ncbi:MAG TPA: hypothetical protein PLW10_20575, partial [Myxococcota bacterium]|nr:hypothetical protein [Myxococcota bacterium]
MIPSARRLLDLAAVVSRPGEPRGHPGRLHCCAALCLLVLLHASTLHAGIVSGSLMGGQAASNGGTFLVVTGASIGTLGNNAFDDDNVRAFDEMQDLTLTSNLILDVVAPGIPSNVLGPGSTISSHYLIFDPATTTDAIGSISFDEPIV